MKAYGFIDMFIPSGLEDYENTWGDPITGIPGFLWDILHENFFDLTREGICSPPSGFAFDTNGKFSRVSGEGTHGRPPGCIPLVWWEPVSSELSEDRNHVTSRYLSRHGYRYGAAELFRARLVMTEEAAQLARMGWVQRGRVRLSISSPFGPHVPVRWWAGEVVDWGAMRPLGSAGRYYECELVLALDEIWPEA